MAEKFYPARRVASTDELTRPGDYCGPEMVTNPAGDGTSRRVWYLLPTADPFDPHRRYDGRKFIIGNGRHCVAEPPWKFRECKDGSLEIRDSIAISGHDPDVDEPGGVHQFFHGFLDEGNRWRMAG
jgi:hypothetical protein